MKTDTFDDRGHFDHRVLKDEFLRCVGVRAKRTAELPAVVRALVDKGISRQILLGWAVEAGYNKKYVTGLLSRIFVSLGLRDRKKGAGRKPSLAALELLAHARNQYDEKCLGVLYAAWRAGKAQLAAAKTPNEIGQSGFWSNSACTSAALLDPQSNSANTITVNSSASIPSASSIPSVNVSVAK